MRSRPGQIEIQETLAKIVDAAQSDVTTQLGSLEETVLTLAEALLRPNAPQIPAPREASRDGQQGRQPHLTPQGVGLGGYRERYVPGVLGAGVRGKAGRG